jgi:crotonobetainyl-CoA:carnitine CoA-transferase CaiB-like acyl-CoA transferase
MFPTGALTGITVLDLTRLLPGPLATQWLADMGATVIKVEEPERGDYMRTLNPVAFPMVNRGKKSLALNLKTQRDLFYKLAERCDVLIEGFRPGVMERLGCGWETLRGRNPRLVYAAITGYGYEGPYRDLAGHDINYLSIAGVLEGIGAANGPPVLPSVQIADIAGGSMQAVMGILAALFARERTGEGQFIDASMTHGSALLLQVPLGLVASGHMPGRGDELLSGRYACYNIYEARDGRYVAVGALEEKFWATLCGALGCEEFIPDQFAEGERRLEIIRGIAQIFRTRDAEQWFEQLRGMDACVTPIRTPAEAAIDLNLLPGDDRPIPSLGEHTAEILDALR